MNSSDSSDPDERSKRSPYQTLIEQSRKLGGLATTAVSSTRDFLLKEIPLKLPPSPEVILFGEQNNRPDISAIAERSHEILAGAHTVFLPINLFPDSIVVDRTKVTINNRTFFWTAKTITTRIEDILSVTSSTGPFFASLTISTRVMNSTDHYEINYFWRKDALYLKQIIQGYVIAQHNGITTAYLDREELIKTLLELGKDSNI